MAPEHTGSRTAPTQPDDAVVELTDGETSRLWEVFATARSHVAGIPQDTAGLRVFVVGGAVRDAIYGADPNDIDYVVVGATPDELRERGFVAVDASSFGVFNDSDHDEWTLARTVMESGDDRGDESVGASDDDVTIHDALCGHDLRMNGMAIQLQPLSEPPASVDSDSITPFSVPSGSPADHDAAAGFDAETFLIDPFGGVNDVRSGEITHISGALAEDPIRVLRAARYRSRYVHSPEGPDSVSADAPDTVPFGLTPSTRTRMRNVSPELNRMSRNRIGGEIRKAMQHAVDPPIFWRTLRAVGALAVLVPTLDRGTIVPAGPDMYHREGDVFAHTMLVLEEMHELCCARDITGTARVRRYLMAIAHDLGKVPIADERGGLRSDDPPTRFSGHAAAGTEVVSDLVDRLGLPNHFEAAMRDAASLHMDFHDLLSKHPADIIRLVDNHTTAKTAETPTFATVWELLDLAQADEQGRLQNRGLYDNEDSAQYTEDPDAPDDAVQPVFDRERYAAVIGAAHTAIDTIDGFRALRTGLCETHSDTDIDNVDLQETLRTCTHCRTPDPWVADELTILRVDKFTDLASPKADSCDAG